MNNTYRLVWNATLGLWQAAPETAKGRGKNKSSRALRPLHALVALTLASSAYAAAPLPTNGNVVAGEGRITQSGEVMTIDQASGKMAIDWQSFSIGRGNTVIFNQPSTSSVALNRVLGPDASTIQGALRANGQVFLLNPNGVLFSPTAQVNVGGLLASTLGMKLDDFEAGHYQLDGASTQAVVNAGTLRAADSGAVALVAAKVSNTGTIAAPGGGVALGAASQVLVDLGGPVKLQLQKSTVDTLVENGGAIHADGGTVLLTARAASDLSASVINQSGTIRAQTLATGAKGEILLLGDMAQGQLNAGGKLDASAPNGGDGGFIETSAAHVATLDGLDVNAGAAQGRGGEWLVDPYDYVINATAAQNISSTLNTGTSVTITTQASNAQYGGLAGGSGDITVNNAITKAAGGDATLTLRADRNVIVGADIKATSGKLGIVLNAGNGGGTHGGVRVGGNLGSNGGDILVGGARGTANQGIGYATNLNDSEAAVVVEQHKSILSNGGHVTINGLSKVGSSKGNYSGVTGGVYIKSGAKILSGTGDLYITGESSAGLNTFGIGFEANSGTNTVIGSATNGGNMLMNAVNSSLGTAAERDAGAMGMVNYGSVDRLSFYGPSVASWLVFINGVPQLSGYTRTPQLNCVAGYLNCGYLVVPGSNNSYLYAGYEAVSMATKAAYVIQGGAGTKVYDGSTLATNLSLTSLGGPTGFTPASLQPAPLFHTTSKNVGTYTRLVRDAANATSLVSGGETYAVGYFNSGTYAITPRVLTPVVTSKVYDGTSTAAVSAAGMLASDDVRLQGSGSFGGVDSGAYQNVSASGIALAGRDAGNYTLGSSAAAGMSASILPRQLTLAADKTYDGTAGLSGAVVLGNLVAGEDLAYSGANANSIHVDGATHVGAIVLADGVRGFARNYTLPSLAAASGANTASITPRMLDVQVAGTAPVKTYDGSAAAPQGFQPAYTVSGLAAADSGARVAIGAATVTYNSANVLEANRLNVSGMTVAGVDGGVARAGDYVLASANQGIAAGITARPLAIAATDAAKTYGDADPALAYRITSGNLVGGDSLTGQVVRAAGENVGAYAIDASGLSNPNYAVTAQGAALTVTPRAITVAADNLTRTYGDADPALSYRVVQGNLVGADRLTGALTRAAGENVGSYAIDAADLANGNYLVTAQNGILSITPRAVSVLFGAQDKVYGDADPLLSYRILGGSLARGDTLGVARAAGENVGSYAIDAVANPNYALTSTLGALSIRPRALGIAADGASKTYGDADPALAYRITSGNLVGGDSLTGQVVRAAGENVGAYAIDASGLSNPNYAVTAQGAALTVTPRAITVAADNLTRTYGDADPALSYRVVQGNLVGADRLAGALTRAAGENVGSYAIDAAGLANGNYLVTAQNGILSITPRALSVLFGAQDKVYGDADPLLSYRILGGSLARGDTLSVARAAGENVGSYAIDAIANPNYALTSTPGALSIRPRSLGITVDDATKTYGDADPALAYHITSGSLVGSDALTGSLQRAGGENAGSYAIEAGTLANGNYVLTVKDGSLQIAPRPVSVSADSLLKSAGAADPQLTWRLTGGNLVGDDVLAGQLARAAGEDAGSYAIGQGSLGNRNYAIAFNGATLAIAAAPVAAPQPVPMPPPVVEQPVAPPPAPVVEQPAAPPPPPVVAEQPAVPAPAPAVEQPAVPAPPPVVAEQPVVPAPAAVVPPVVQPPAAPAPAPVVAQPAPVVAQQPAPAARPAVNASAYTNIVPELVPPTVGALSYVAVAERSGTQGGAAEDEAAALERAASHAPTSGRDVKFLDVMVVGGGINTGNSVGDSTGDSAATRPAPAAAGN